MVKCGGFCNVYIYTSAMWSEETITELVLVGDPSSLIRPYSDNLPFMVNTLVFLNRH